jgi:peptidoglycan/xylan/chitin deacetylase (PgdA/CDA1 family)
MVLTFDDGYAEHYRDVFPLLRQAAIPATFFPAASALIERRLLDVNKIQFILAAVETSDILVASIDEAVEGAKWRTDVRPLSEYRAEGWKAVRFDSPAASYVKYMLQGALPEDFRTGILDDLFAKFVSADQHAFAEELYMTADQAREIREAGMTIGAHADRHVTLTSLSRDDQAHEIDGALRVLDAVGSARSGFAFSYAKGAYNDDSLALLRDRACAIAVTTGAATRSSDLIPVDLHDSTPSTDGPGCRAHRMDIARRAPAVAGRGAARGVRLQPDRRRPFYAAGRPHVAFNLPLSHPPVR